MNRSQYILGGAAFQTLVLAAVNQFLWPVNLWASFVGLVVAMAAANWWESRP